LAAIMFTDLVGFTALTQSDESQSLTVLDRHNRLLRPIFARFNGREVKTIGDSFLVEFDSALEAADCALEIQRFLHDYNISSKDDWKITLRIGIHLGDVVTSDGDIFGDAVNIASRLQPVAEPGGICISEQVYDQVRNKFRQPFLKLEPRDLKGVRFPIDVYKVVMPWESGSNEQQSHLEPTRIAVLPFASMSPDPDDEYFADGLTEELIDKLCQIKELEVIARTSVMNYKRKEKSASQIGNELRAGALIEGSVRKAGNRVRVTAQLINANTEGHLWSSHYDGTLDDIFAVQSEIAEKVAGELKVKLLETEKKTIEKKPTQNTQSYILFLQAREKYREQTEHSLKMAVELFQKSVDLDPDFAIAYDGIAKCYVALGNDGYLSQAQALPKAELAVKKALSLDPDLAEAHATFATIYFAEDHDKESELEAKRAIELNPSIAEALRMMANISLLKGELEEGVRLWESAYNLDPLRTWYIERLGLLYFYEGKEEKALEFWRRTSDFAPAATQRNMTEYFMSKGDVQAAKEHFAQAERLEPTNPWLGWMRGYIAAYVGDKEGARRAIAEMEDNFSETTLNSIAFVYYALGDLDAYFTYINRASEQHVFRYIYVMYSPLFAKARDDPRYQELLAREEWGKHA
jgi:adenylate cyclase